MSESELFIKEWRAGDNFPTALLIHGMASSSITWSRLAKDLNSIGYNVIAPDLRGHGKSPRADQYSAQGWADDIIALGLKPELIVGHSMGGLVAALAQSQLKASKLILIDPVFILPKDEKLLKSIQDVFTQIMYSKTLKHVEPVGKLFSNQPDPRRETIGIRQWDKTSVSALLPSPKAIASLLVSGTEDILLLRARGSFIVPNHVMKRKFRENVTLATLDVGHNIHIHAYDDFWNTVKDFILREEPDGGNILSNETTLQDLS